MELSPRQLKVLLSFAKLDILESGRQAVAFGLVRAIIARKLVCEEVYELVDTISEHMVTSQSEQTRALSAHTLLQVNHPLHAQFTCFTSTKVHILTRAALLAAVSARVSDGRQAATCACHEPRPQSRLRVRIWSEGGARGHGAACREAPAGADGPVP